MRKRNAAEKYKCLRLLLELPRVNSEEEAQEQIAVEEGDQIRFLLVKRAGSYTVCTAYLNTARDGTTSWNHREEFTFSHYNVVRARHDAALAVGLELVEDFVNEQS